jgi:hypothetical protein
LLVRELDERLGLSALIAKNMMDDRDGTPRQIGPKEGTRVYDAVCLAAQNGNSGLIRNL